MRHADMKNTYRLSAAEDSPGLPTIVHTKSNQSILAIHGRTPVFADPTVAERVLVMLNSAHAPHGNVGEPTALEATCNWKQCTSSRDGKCLASCKCRCHAIRAAKKRASRNGGLSAEEWATVSAEIAERIQALKLENAALRAALDADA